MKNIYFAACSPDGGVYNCTFEDEKLTIKSRFCCENPMFLAKNGEDFYTILRKTHGDFSSVTHCKVLADGSLSAFETPVSTNGIVACHLCVHDGDIYTTNYLSGSISRIRNGICDKTVTHTGCGVHPTRQDAPHTHFVNVTPDGKYLVSTDLGIDTVFIYDFDLNEISHAKVPAGSGARHLVFSRDGKRMYCVNELSNDVSVFEYSDGTLKILGTFPALPDGFEGNNTAAAIRLSDNGKYLYVSNRGHDSITCFEICGDKLIPLSHTPCGGKGPRDFDIKDGYLFCTNEGTGNVTVFRCSGAKLEKLDTEIEAKGALCVIFE